MRILAGSLLCILLISGCAQTVETRGPRIDIYSAICTLEYSEGLPFLKGSVTVVNPNPHRATITPHQVVLSVPAGQEEQYVAVLDYPTAKMYPEQLLIDIEFEAYAPGASVKNNGANYILTFEYTAADGSVLSTEGYEVACLEVR